MSKHSLDSELSGFILNLRAALPYLEEFDKQTFVIYLSGKLIEFQNSRVIEDLALLQQVGIRIVLVHGVELQIRNFYASQGLDYHTEDGIFAANEKIYLMLIKNGNIYSISHENSKTNYEKLTILINDFLKTYNLMVSEISKLYVNRGPGSFAGIRNSLSVVKALFVAKKN